jgi:hypothetical protein
MAKISASTALRSKNEIRKRYAGVLPKRETTRDMVKGSGELI